MIFRRSTDVPVLDNYEGYRDPYLRPDFQYRCAYCLTHEHYFLDGDAGEIDHHRPLNPPSQIGKDFSELKNVYENLYWSCSRCNRIKGNRWPTDAQYAAGERFLDPCVEDHDAHWATHPDGTITPFTLIGHYTIRKIRLDRPALNRRRAQLYQDQQKFALLEAELERRDISREHQQILRDYLADVRQRIFPPNF
jgi:hypothetical protein